MKIKNLFEKYNDLDSKLQGKIVHIISGEYKGDEYRIENWANKVFGGNWQECRNTVVYLYLERAIKDQLPFDQNVYYGKIGHFGHLIHASEIEVQNDTE